MSTPVDYAISNAYWGIGLETTQGTAVNSSSNGFVPLMDPKWTPKVTWIDDKGTRGSAVDMYDQVPGVRHDEFSFKANMYPNLMPWFFTAALGSADTISTGGPPYTHTIGLQNDQVGSQPPSYTLNYFDGGTLRTLPGQVMSDLSLSFAVDADVQVTGTYMGWAEQEGTAITSTNTPTAQHLVPSWSVGLQIGTAASAVYVSAQIDIKRNTQVINTIGQQGPHLVFAGPAAVSGKISAVFEAGDPTFANALVRSQNKYVFTFTEPVSTDTIVVQMDNVQLEDPVLNVGKEYLTIDSNFRAVPNTTDMVTTGYSAIKTVTTNQISSHPWHS